jgi:predicted Rossmann-fold nucleotide-binding protein
MPAAILTLDQLHAHLRTHGDLRDTVVHELDLREQGERLRGVAARGALLLGCRLDAATLAHLYEQGAELFPPLRELDLPFRPYRAGLYDVDELFEGFDPADPGSFWSSSRDSRIYEYFTARRHTGAPLPVVEALAMRLHDHAIEAALAELLHDRPGGRRVVAIMGGHAMQRDAPIYAELARMARTLTRAGYFMATGGGPGAMEAGNLGAYLAPHDDAALDEALALLREQSDYREHRYLECSLAVRTRWPKREGGESLAIPTWFYGHEPSNMFASHVAKYFANSVREDGLLAIATHGVIYAPGSAGTVQEVFMDACQNHYVTFEVVSPMVMFGREHWTRTLPVWPLLEAMSKGRPWGRSIALCDTADEVLACIAAHPPFRP